MSAPHGDGEQAGYLLILQAVSGVSDRDVAEHTDGDTLGVDGTQVGIFEQRHKVGFDRLLKGTDRRRLEAKVGLEILCNFTNETLEGELAD